jgi:hypothetical protein
MVRMYAVRAAVAVIFCVGADIARGENLPMHLFCPRQVKARAGVATKAAPSICRGSRSVPTRYPTGPGAADDFLKRHENQRRGGAHAARR